VLTVHSPAGGWRWYARNHRFSQRYHRTRITESQEPRRQVHRQRVRREQWTSCRHTGTDHHIRVSHSRPTATNHTTQRTHKALSSDN